MDSHIASRVAVCRQVTREQDDWTRVTTARSKLRWEGFWIEFFPRRGPGCSLHDLRSAKRELGWRRTLPEEGGARSACGFGRGAAWASPLSCASLPSDYNVPDEYENQTGRTSASFRRTAVLRRILRIANWIPSHSPLRKNWTCSRVLGTSHPSDLVVIDCP